MSLPMSPNFGAQDDSRETEELSSAVESMFTTSRVVSEVQDGVTFELDEVEVESAPDPDPVPEGQMSTTGTSGVEQTAAQPPSFREGSSRALVRRLPLVLDVLLDDLQGRTAT